jgi:hypothetical protein
MTNILRVTGMIFVAKLCTAALPPPVPITTEAELRSAASEVPVSKIDFTIPDKETAAEEALSKRFFNKPEEHRYSGMSNADWSVKWQIFSDALIAKAKTQHFDSQSLEACLRALNRGRNSQTMLWPFPEQKIFPPGTPDETIDAFEKKAKEKFQQELKEREKNPEQWYNESLAVVPVAAYLGRHSKGDCWIVVCKWEMITKDMAMPLGHIMVWALDTKSSAVVGYVTCD